MTDSLFRSTPYRPYPLLWFLVSSALAHVGLGAIATIGLRLTPAQLDVTPLEYIELPSATKPSDPPPQQSTLSTENSSAGGEFNLDFMPSLEGNRSLADNSPPPSSSTTIANPDTVSPHPETTLHPSSASPQGSPSLESLVNLFPSTTMAGRLIPNPIDPTTLTPPPISSQSPLPRNNEPIPTVTTPGESIPISQLPFNDLKERESTPALPKSALIPTRPQTSIPVTPPTSFTNPESPRNLDKPPANNLKVKPPNGEPSPSNSPIGESHLLGGTLAFNNNNLSATRRGQIFNSNRQTNQKQQGIDTQKEIDLAPYLDQLKRRVERQWIPGFTNSSSRTVLQFTVEKDGQVSGLRVISPSRFPMTDQVAVDAIQRASPFEPLPQGYDKERIDIQFTFDINTYGNLNLSEWGGVRPTP